MAIVLRLHDRPSRNLFCVVKASALISMSLPCTEPAPSWLHLKGGPGSLHTGGGQFLPVVALTGAINIHTESLYSESQTQELLGKKVLRFGVPTPGHVILSTKIHSEIRAYSENQLSITLSCIFRSAEAST